jgi:hypothetical protein
MKIENIIDRKNSIPNPKLDKTYKKMSNLIDALNKKEITPKIASIINDEILLLNNFTGTDKELIKSIKKSYPKIIKLVEKELKLVPKNHFRNLYLGLGLVFGVALGASIFKDNMGLGIPLGMVIGLALGTNKDKEVEKTGKQLEIEVD